LADSGAGVSVFELLQATNNKAVKEKQTNRAIHFFIKMFLR
jgi:hypothetical protein